MEIVSSRLEGIDARQVFVDVKVHPDHAPSLEIAGLPLGADREARVRVRSAIRESGFTMPRGKVVVTIHPVGVNKSNTTYDLAIALGILAETGQVPEKALDGWAVLGELSLSGEIRPVRGVLAVAEMARALGLRGVICGLDCAREASLVPGVKVGAGRKLGDVVACLRGDASWPEISEPAAETTWGKPCWSDVRGQQLAKRALEVAAAGGHNVLLSGTPGCGKTMLARRLTTILPPLADDEALTGTKILSITGLLPRGGGLVRDRPFRAPHHTASLVSLVGGGSTPRPGELTLAHNGVLFLDELPEFSHQEILSLRGPIRDGFVDVGRGARRVTFPSKVMLVAAMNPCHCGWLGSPMRDCSCTSDAIARYRRRILQGPLVQEDIDIHVRLPQFRHSEVADNPNDTSEVVQKRVVAALARQKARYSGSSSPTNGRIPFAVLETKMPLSADASAAMAEHFDTLTSGAMARDKVWRIAATIADLDGADEIGTKHFAEAMQYRCFDGPDLGQGDR